MVAWSQFMAVPSADGAPAAATASTDGDDPVSTDTATTRCSCEVCRSAFAHVSGEVTAQAPSSEVALEAATTIREKTTTRSRVGVRV